MALHEAALALSAPVYPDRVSIEALLACVLCAAVRAVGGCDGRLVLAEDAAWRHLAPAGGSFPDPVLVDAAGPLRRAPLRSGGATVHVLATGRRIAVPDVRRRSPFGTYAEVYPDLRQLGVWALAYVPLLSNGRVTGVLSVSLAYPREPMQEEWEILELFAVHAAAAVERARVALADHHRAQRAEQLSATLGRIGGADGIQDALTALAHGTVTLLGADQGGIRVFDADGHGTSFAFWISPNGTLLPASHAVPPSGSVAAEIRGGGPAQLIDDLLALPSPSSKLREQRQERRMRSSIAVPVNAGRRRIGSLHVDHHVAGFLTREDLAVAETLAALAGAAIERAHVDAARRESENRCRALLELSPEPIAVHSAGRFVFVNPATAQLLGASRPEHLLGEPVLRFIHPDCVEQVRAHRAQLRREGACVPLAEQRLIRIDGITIDVEVTSIGIRYGGEPAVLVIARDVTERKRLEDALAERLRLEGALLVARTAAHELNNAFSPVLGFAELLENLSEAQANDEIVRYARLISQVTAEAAEKVQRLHQITRLEHANVALGIDYPVLDLERSSRPAE